MTFFCLVTAIAYAFPDKKYLNLILVIILPTLAVYSGGLAIWPSYMDGVEEHFAQYKETEFLELRDDLLSQPSDTPDSPFRHNKLPEELYTKHTLLQKLYPHASFHTEDEFVAGYYQSIYYAIEESSIKVYSSNGRQGDRGFAVYAPPDQDPYKGKTEYMGSFRKIYPHVFLYNQTF